VRSTDEGFVVSEWVLSVAVLLLPVVVLVATLPHWAERRHAATVAAREAASAVVRDGVGVPARAEEVARSVARNHGIDPGDVTIDVAGGGARGGIVTVSVHVRMPAVAVPGLGAIAGWTYTATQHRRVDDYASR